ncbi:uncharacterized protein rab11fip1b [Chaetodon auriga]|uniref:uncharacterized protein rab11fip1b n=1 Tax=Chaetodon auriga TaxID=39042 RepID=UPI004032F4F6
MSLADQQWCPTSVQVTVLQARGLRIKGKSGTNDAYAVMQVGKEKYQTSVMEKSVAPVWKEEAAFDLPQLQLQQAGGGTERSMLRVHVLHRALVGPDKLLGQAVINLLQLSEDRARNKTEWFKLLDKTGKADKDRGEVLVDIQFMRNNMTASMFDLSAAGKSRSRLGKFKDKVRGKKKESDSVSSVVPSFSQVLTDSEEEGNEEGEVAAAKDEKKKKPKIKSLFSPKSNLQRNMSQSMSVLPAKNSSLSGSQSSGLNVDPEGKKKFKFKIHKRSGSSDSKDSSSGHQKHSAPEQSNLCINGSHIYCEEPQARTSRIGSNYSLASSGHGSMDDVPESSPPSVDSLRAVRQYSPWTEEEEEEEETKTAEAENVKEDVDELRREEEEMVRMEQERRRREEEEERVRRQEEFERLAEEKRRLEEEERRRIEEEERRQREEEERMEEEKRRQEEERKLAEEKKRLEEEERRQIEEERVRKEQEERIRREEEERAQEERRRQEEEHERLAEEKRRLEEQQRRIEEEEKRKREEEERIKREEEMALEERRRQEEECERLAEEKRRLEEQEKRIEEEERIRREEEMALEEMRRQEEEERARRQEEERLEEQERRRIEAEEKKQREEEERIRKEHERRRQEEEEMVKRQIEEREENRRLEEQERRRREEEERIKKEEEEKAWREKEEYERLLEEKRKLEEEERERIEAEEKIRKEEERVRMEEERKRKEEEVRARREEEEHKKLAEEKRILEEQERRRIEEEEEKRQREEEERIRKEEKRKEEEERVRKEKEEYERLVEEKMRQEEEERRRIEEEEKIRHKEQERIEMEKERRRQEEEEEKIKREEEERVRREEKEEQARKLEKVTRNTEEEENKTKDKAAGMKSKGQSAAEVTSTNPFDENFSTNPFDEDPTSPAGPRASPVKQRSQSAVSSLGSKAASTDEKDLISTQREKRPAPQPPGRPQAERQSQREQDESAPHLPQISKQSNDKDVKTASVLPQRSVQMIAPLSRPPADAKNTQSSTTKETTNAAKHSKRPAPSRPGSVEEAPSSGPKTASSSGGKIGNKFPPEAKQKPIVYGLNPFEDDEDEDGLAAQGDTANTGSVQWPPPMAQDAEKDAASPAKIKSSKMARAPPLPAKKGATSSTSIKQNTEGGRVTDDTGVAVPDNSETHPCDPEPVRETPVQESQHVTVQSTREEGDGRKEGTSATPRRLQPVKPLNPLRQQSVSVVQGEIENKSTGIHSEVQEKTQVNGAGPKGPYSQLTREELISLVLKQENQLSQRDSKISELEQYIDNLLVRVIEEKPSILMSINSLNKPV